jgi:hypothetical protein
LIVVTSASMQRQVEKYLPNAADFGANYKTVPYGRGI